MNDKQIKEIIENNLKKEENSKKIEKMQYTMDFGDIAIQYDFCLN